VAHRSETTPVARRDVALVVGLVLVAILVLLFTPVLVASTIQPVLAWGATAMLVLAALWMPLRRFRSWPDADRRAAVRSVGRAAPAAILLTYVASAVGAAATILALAPDRGFVTRSWAVPLSPLALPFLLPAAAALLFALRPVTPLAAATWTTRKGLATPPPVWVTHELRRLRVWRAVPAVFGAGIGAGPSAVYARWLEVHGPERAAEGMVLSEASMAWPFDPLTLALAGYLLGLVIAEATRRHPVPGSSAARLTARTPSNYLTRPARLIPVVFAGWTLIAATIAWAAGEQASFVTQFMPRESAVWWPAAAAVGLAAVVLAVQRWVVRRPQRLERLEDLHIDDVLRSSAAHGLSGAAGALLLWTAIGTTDAAIQAFGIDAFAGAIVGAVLAALSIGGVWALWLGYGSSHRGQIPLTADGPPTPPASSTRSEEPVT
jgi:hypothetical protein